jgi:alpha-galactosidase
MSYCKQLVVLLIGGFALSAIGVAAVSQSTAARTEAQAQTLLQQKDAPANGLWIDSLDLTGVPIRRPRGGGPGRAGQPPPPPPPPIKIMLGAVEYPHGLPIAGNGVNSDITIDLKGAATRFQAMVGIDGANKPGQGSAVFGVWVDGKKVADSGVLRGGDAPKLISVPLIAAKQIILATVDSGDGPGGDNANWGGALLTLAAGAQAKPAILPRQREAPPAIAPSRTDKVSLNFPRVTGATPGRPFLFKIPASGANLTFAAKNLPDGLTLNAETGIITGALKAAGRTAVEITATGSNGTATETFTIVSGVDALAQTPPLGWNSWNVWAAAVDDAKTRAAADYMVSTGLAAQGYQYINIDDTWEGQRDASGVLRTNQKFPDMKALSEYVHGKGLKLGIYSSPGPTTCQRLPGSYQYEEIDARTWAEWGIDYLKYDWCGYSSVEQDRTSWPALQKPYLHMRRILDRTDRDIIYSLCQYGWGNVWEWGNEVGGNLWRTTGDITDTWTSMSGIGFAQAGHEKYAGPGHWNDPDMLVVGKVGWGPNIHDTRLTPNEQLVHITLWSLQAAPLLIGADMAALDPFTIDLLGNREVLAVDQDPLGKAAGRITADPWSEVWARPMADGTWAVGLFNRGPEAAPVSVKLAALGLPAGSPVRDLWKHQDLAPAQTQFTATVPRHGAVFVRIGKPRN